MLLHPHFEKHGWYCGAGFSGKSIDSLHFEISEEFIKQKLVSLAHTQTT